MIRGIIYKYTSPSGKVYIGQTINEKDRRKHFLIQKLSYGGTDQLQRVKAYESQLMQLQKTASKELIWDSIDNEMNALTESQKNRFFWR